MKMGENGEEKREKKKMERREDGVVTVVSRNMTIRSIGRNCDILFGEIFTPSIND